MQFLHRRSRTFPDLSAQSANAARQSRFREFDFRETLQGPEHVSEFFKITVGSLKLDAMDFWRLNKDGLIQEMAVLWRTLPAVAAVQQKLQQAS